MYPKSADPDQTAPFCGGCAILPVFAFTWISPGLKKMFIFSLKHLPQSPHLLTCVDLNPGLNTGQFQFFCLQMVRTLALITLV